MKLSRLLTSLNLPCPPENPEIIGLTCDSRQVKPGMLFAALPGARQDGTQFLREAEANGAAAVLAGAPLETELPSVTVSNPRESLAQLAGEFYCHPDRDLVTIAVTGTKGKTTTAHMIRDILQADGHKTGMIGTLGAFVGGALLEETGNTTPEPVTLHRILRNMADEGCTHAVLEVSSQAMKLGRVADIVFDAAVFLNLTPDHIGAGEHADFDEYRACKAALFRQCRLAVGNADDPNWPVIAGQIPDGIPVITFGEGKTARMCCVSVAPDGAQALATLLSVAGTGEPYRIPMPGRFNARNALAALTVCRALGVEDGAIRAGLARVSVPGRTQRFPTANGVTVLLDYAHNGESMRALLAELAGYPHNRIIIVFGAGGDRPPMRRADLGRAAAQGADFAVLTEDNPRSEPAEVICLQIARAIRGAIPCTILPDRRQAIRFALDLARPGDILALLGKGHEQYIETQGIRRHFSEWEVLEEYFGEKRGEG